jgi:hypothetical protein
MKNGKLWKRAEFYLPGKQMSSKRQSCGNTINQPAPDTRIKICRGASPPLGTINQNSVDLLGFPSCHPAALFARWKIFWDNEKKE